MRPSSQKLVGDDDKDHEEEGEEEEEEGRARDELGSYSSEHLE